MSKLRYRNSPLKRYGHSLSTLAMGIYVLLFLAPVWVPGVSGNAVLMNCPVHGMMAAAESHQNAPDPAQNSNGNSRSKTGSSAMACPFCMARGAATLHEGSLLLSALTPQVIFKYARPVSAPFFGAAYRQRPEPRAPPPHILI